MVHAIEKVLMITQAMGSLLISYQSLTDSLNTSGGSFKSPTVITNLVIMACIVVLLFWGTRCPGGDIAWWISIGSIIAATVAWVIHHKNDNDDDDSSTKAVFWIYMGVLLFNLIIVGIHYKDMKGGYKAMKEGYGAIKKQRKNKQTINSSFSEPNAEFNIAASNTENFVGQST